MKWFSPSILLVTFFVILLKVAPGQTHALPFEPGEKLFYEVRWEQIPVANLTLEVRPLARIQDEPAFHFVFRAQTKPAMDALYPVAGHIEAFTDRRLTRSLRFAKDMREGASQRRYQVDFDWRRGVATYANEGRRQRRISLTEGTLDMVSMLYYARSLPLKQGMAVSRPLNSGKRIRQARARVVGHETIGVGGRPWRAFRIEADVRKAGGIFKKSDRAVLTLWISADERKIPIKVVSKVWVGAFVIELTHAVATDPLKTDGAAEG